MINSWNPLTERIWYSPNIVNLCMDSYKEAQQEGRLYHQYTSEAVPFWSLIEAFGQMEKLYDDLVFPQSATRIRSFGEEYRADEMPEYSRKEVEKMESFEKVTEHRGKDATFLIRVQYRQNSSWQGEITWIDGQKKKYFRSALELVHLIDSALGGNDN